MNGADFNGINTIVFRDRRQGKYRTIKPVATLEILLIILERDIYGHKGVDVVIAQMHKRIDGNFAYFRHCKAAYVVVSNTWDIFDILAIDNIGIIFGGSKPFSRGYDLYGFGAFFYGYYSLAKAVENAVVGA